MRGAVCSPARYRWTAHVLDIWRLPETHQDLLTIDPIKATFRSRHTQLLSKELFKIIEDNGPFLRSLSILSNILQGDDVCYPATLLQTSLSTPELAQCRLVTEVTRLRPTGRK